MDLTKAELDFLKQKGFTKNDVYNGLGIKQKYWMSLVKKEGKPIALGNPCTYEKHRLKWPSGHCAQCNPRNIGKGFSDRFSQTKYIYIAGSLSHKVMKIGIGDDPEQRLAVLRRQPYAGVPDWQLLFHMKVPNSARLEHEAISSLSKHVVRLGYFKDGGKQTAIEVIKCSYVDALKAIAKSAKTAESDPWQSPKVGSYEFKQ